MEGFIEGVRVDLSFDCGIGWILLLDARGGTDVKVDRLVRTVGVTLEATLFEYEDPAFFTLFFVFAFWRTNVFFFFAFKKHRFGLQYAPSWVEGSHCCFRPNRSQGLERT